jgi:CRP-like cAMP-binding protein
MGAITTVKKSGRIFACLFIKRKKKSFARTIGAATLYIVVAGTLDVYVRDEERNTQNKVGELKQGTSFGEMSILAGVPRNATCVVPKDAETTVLEVQRPALRLLRKLPKFGHALDETYRRHGLGRVLEDVRQATGDSFSPELLKQLGSAARFIVYGKSHTLFQENEPIDKVVLIKTAGCGACAEGFRRRHFRYYGGRG